MLKRKYVSLPHIEPRPGNRARSPQLSCHRAGCSTLQAGLAGPHFQLSNKQSITRRAHGDRSGSNMISENLESDVNNEEENEVSG